MLRKDTKVHVYVQCFSNPALKDNYLAVVSSG